ncbi:hypothetical protein GCM10009868_25780 [Terrabacter aerolatus]|uniref:Uncharacterized protein n=1 Tax=Terrabacter aerolatus TaxID=422442 RepID=A0A512D6N8_9MICO|nr:hypothetical protein [Terrabacter aerolatus]GEO32126.1 hypothetical protein TAE01_39360 [Terrabacter aerolatus]
MPVSSLIFVVIVAIWAAYLVQHWARRREEAAATRSVDGFTEAMRVLEKRPALPASELSTPRPHSYAVKPAASGRPTVDVKRAVPAGSTRRHSPLVARRGEERVLTATLPAGGRSHLNHTDHDIAPYAEVDRMPESARQPSHGAHGRPRRAEGPAPARVSVAQRRIRAALLLVALLWLPVSVVLTVTGVIMWVSIPFAVLTVGAVLVWLRAEAQSDRLRATADVDDEADHTRRDSRDRGRPRQVMHPVPMLSSDDTQVIRSAPAPAAPEAREVAPRAEAGVFDVQAAPVTGEVPVAAVEAAPVAEGSWSPVPVPRPTYSLKAKAEPRYTDSGIPADVFDTPEFAEEAEELDDRALFARRAVSQ